jgi:hypothetical protein
MGAKVADAERLRKELDRIMRRLDSLEKEMHEVIWLNALNEFLADYGRKAYFLFGPFDHYSALSKLERDSNWPWREVNRRCNFCGCYLFPAKESDRVPPMDNNNIDFEQASREQALSSPGDEPFDPMVRDRMLSQPEKFLTYFYARGRKVPFGDYTVLYFHGPCFERILKRDYEDGSRERFLGSD